MDLASVVHDTPGLFWYTAGPAKQSLLTDDHSYAKAFRRYASAP